MAEFLTVEDSPLLAAGNLQLLKSGVKTDVIKFWQDKNKHEVDIILDFISKQIPIEIKYKEKLKHEDFIGIEAFCDMYKETHTPFLINLDRQEQDNKYEFILPYDLSFLKWRNL